MQTVWKWIQVFILAWIVDFFLFPANFTFTSVNSKIMLALVGVPLCILRVLQTRNYKIEAGLIRTVLLAILYSIVNLIATDYNNLSDFSYANYITTAFVWLFSAYTVVEGIRFVHGKIDLKLITFYLAAVCAAQCFIAIAIDRNDTIKNLVDSIFYINQDFIIETGRLYGLSAMLDPAGTRFAVVLIMIAIVLTCIESVRNSTKQTLWLLIAFVIIVGIGNMISRTTITGAALAVMVLALSGEGYRFIVRKESFKLYSTLAFVIIVTVPIMVYLYHTDEFFYYQIRYGFEGFFSLVEKGEWQTDSNDVLATMWKWPETAEGWLIGYGEFDGFRFGTDIGYCRLILYSGVIGFGIFSIYFIHHAIYFMKRYPQYQFFFFLLLSMSFIIWLKVSTDLFQFWALFYAYTEYDTLAPKYKERLALAAA